MGIREAYNEYLRLHPKTRQQYSPTPANHAKWLRAVKAAQQNADLPSTTFDSSEIEAIRVERRVSTWFDFDAETRARYTLVAMCYPGRQVYACGSRVRGDYADGTARVAAARAKAGMKMRASIRYPAA